jgi:hypothetical protein
MPFVEWGKVIQAGCMGLSFFVEQTPNLVGERWQKSFVSSAW